LHDGYVSLAHANAYQAEIANSMLKIIANVGHLPHVEAADRCASLMMKFLRAPMA